MSAMTSPCGVHHIAIATADMKKQIEFFTQVLGFELIALYWMHGVEGAWHGFLKARDGSCVALVFTDEITKVEGEFGKTHAGNAGAACAPGTLQHLAFNIETQEELLAMRDRIRSHGVHVLGEMDHGLCKSIYFAGLEGLTLEFACSEGCELNPDQWIDPEVVELAGISAEELARYRSPAVFERPASPVPQPVDRNDGPKMVYPEELYQRMVRLSDEEFTERSRENDPPVAA